MTSAVPKILALTFSLMIGGGYVWFRSGGSIPYLAPAKQTANPDKVGFAETPVFNDANDIVVPPEIRELSERDRTFIGGSKSARPFTQENLPTYGPNFEYVDLDSIPPDERVIMGGSKSSGVDFRRVEKQESPKPEPTLLPGSKSMRIDISSAPPAPKQQRTILSGTKSQTLDLIRLNPAASGAQQTKPATDSNRQPSPPPETPPAQSLQETEQKKRTVMPSTKVMMINLVPEAARSSQQPSQPATDSNRKPSPQPETPPAQAQQQTQQKPRTLLPGSKSRGIPLDREN